MNAGTRRANGLPLELIEVLSAGALAALDVVQFPAFAVDHDRRVRWQNAAAIELVGDVRGKLDRSLVAPEDLAQVRDAFARKQLGELHTEYEVTLLRSDGKRVRVAVSSVPLRGRDAQMIGSFAIASIVRQPEPPSERGLRLTPRQRQTLTLLAAGYSTAEMADLMVLSDETVRNHVKRLLRRLGVHSRVEAIAKARSVRLI